MLLDHIGVGLVVGHVILENSVAYAIFRVAGRLAFPIFAFLISEGVRHTKSMPKYLLRLLLLAIVSEVPFDLFRTFQWFSFETQNVVWTLLLGAAVLCLLRYSAGLPKEKRPFGYIGTGVLAAGLFFFIRYVVRSDYGCYGFLMVVIPGLLLLELPRLRSQIRNEETLRTLFCFLGMLPMIIVNLQKMPVEKYAFFALLPILFYHGTRGRDGKGWRWAFYLFYPVHLTVILLIFYRRFIFTGIG